MILSSIKKNKVLDSRRTEVFILITLISSSFVLRFYGVGDSGFNNDETIYVGQAGSLANFDEFREHFSIFRAHPLLMQFFVGLSLLTFGLSETSARLVASIMGTGVVLFSYFIAKFIYSKPIAIVSSLILTFLPYHIIISRQVLVDVSLSFFLILNILMVVLYLRNNNNLFLYCIGACSGLSFLSKEVGMIVIIATLFVLALDKKINGKNIFIILSTFLLVSSPYWISYLFIEDAQISINQYIAWQSSRPPNHDNFYYLDILAKESLGYPLLFLVFLFYIYFIVNRKLWNTQIVSIPLVWIPILVLFYQSISIKNYTFLYSVIPLFVIIGTSFVFGSWLSSFRIKILVIIILVPIILISNAYFLYNFVFLIPHNPILGSESIPYMKDVSLWMKENTPENSTALTLYTHMSNNIKYYSHRDSFSLQSNNNPSYDKIDNADFLIISKKINYLVYEKIQLENAQFLKNEAQKMDKYIKKYNAIPVYISYEYYTDEDGKTLSKPAIIVYSIN